MKLIMVQQISGTRGDDAWPPPGHPLTVGEDEGNLLIRNGLAVQAPEDSWPPAEERATVEARTETAAEVRTAPVKDAARAESDAAKEEALLSAAAPRRGPGRPRKDSLPQ